MNKCTKVFGPPGTGKSTTLLKEVASYLAEGINPEHIGFVSFTKAATEEVKDRACSLFDYPEKSFKNFRTLHSLAFSLLSLDRKSVIGLKEYQYVAETCGMELTSRATRLNTDEGLWIGATRGDKILFIENIARVSNVSIDDILTSSEFDDIDRLEVEMWGKSLKSYKEANVLVDFTDMLVNWINYGVVPYLKVLFVDEAQDLSSLQWKMVRKLAEQPLDLWLAGDDDQAIFKWSGASPEEFVNYEGEQIVLSHSYRVPKKVHKVALDVQGCMSGRVDKIYTPREEEGSVHYYAEIQDVDMSVGNWLILVRNNYFISHVEAECRKLGYWYDSFFDPPSRCVTPIIAYTDFMKGKKITPAQERSIEEMVGQTINQILTWQEKIPWYEAFYNMDVEKKAYYRSVLARNENIRAVEVKKGKSGRPLPRIRISTIHSAKGGEEDNVVILTDISAKTYNKMQEDISQECRVWYVAVTRARKTLHFVRPQTDKYIDIFNL